MIYIGLLWAALVIVWLNHDAGKHNWGSFWHIALPTIRAVQRFCDGAIKVDRRAFIGQRTE
jgi:hypothetical protein